MRDMKTKDISYRWSINQKLSPKYFDEYFFGAK